MKEKLMKMLEDRKEEIIEIRRYLHEHPELSFEEENTSKYIEEFYKGKDVEVHTRVGGDTALSLPLKVVSQGTPLDYVLISMHFQL